VRHITPIKIQYVQFARILRHWAGIPRLVGRLGFRSKGWCQLSAYCVSMCGISRFWLRKGWG